MWKDCDSRFRAVLYLPDQFEDFIVNIFKLTIDFFGVINDTDKEKASFVVSKSDDIARKLLVALGEIFERLTENGFVAELLLEVHDVTLPTFQEIVKPLYAEFC